MEISRKNLYRLNARAFTLIELLIVLAIISLLAAILFPVFARARENARRTSCASNLKQLAMGMLQYAQDYDEIMPEDMPNSPNSIYISLSDGTQSSSLPPGCSGFSATPTTCVQWFWPDLIFPYIKNAQVFNDPTNINSYFNGAMCTSLSGDVPCVQPTSIAKPWIYQGPYLSAINPNSSNLYRNGRNGISYGYNMRIGNALVRNSLTRYSLVMGHLSSAQNPSETLLLAESRDYRVRVPTDDNSPSGYMHPRHLHGLNVAFLDGHVKWMKWEVVTVHPVTLTAYAPEVPAPGVSSETLKLWLPNYIEQ